jgi:hypothetical protein
MGKRGENNYRAVGCSALMESFVQQSRQIFFDLPPFFVVFCW